MTACEICGSPTKLSRNRTCSRECEGARRKAGKWLDCAVCGERFYRKRTEVRSNSTCSYACAAKVSGNLKPTPKGVRRSPSTEFKGGPPHNALPVGSVTIRRRPGRGDDTRAWVKVSEPNVWRPRAIVEYERAYGPVPAGFIVHHIDHDSLNDAPDNLVAMSRAEHLAHHHHDAA